MVTLFLSFLALCVSNIFSGTTPSYHKNHKIAPKLDYTKLNGVHERNEKDKIKDLHL